MDDAEIAELLRRLDSPQWQEGWDEFLRSYASVILQVVRMFERDADHVSDCFLYACQELSRNRCRRLRRYKPKGAASFPTWLRAVVRHLCVDWHRQEFGRERIFQSIGRLTALEQEIFRKIHRDGLSSDEAFETLRVQFRSLTREDFLGGLERIERTLTPRQRWLLATRAAPLVAIGDAVAKGEAREWQIADPAPDPESAALQSEERRILKRMMAELRPEERLLLRLRFEQGLTLNQVGRITKAGEAQAVDRQIREILGRLRKAKESG